MGESRFTNLALGKYNNFFATTANVFAEADTTPDVTNGVLFFSNNTTNTVITHFDLTSTSQAGNNAGAFEGKVIKVVFLDDSTGLANAANLKLASSDGLQGANNAIELVYHNSAWIEFSRSVNQTGMLSATSADLGAAGTVNAKGRDVVTLVSSAGSQPTLRLATNGYQGQILRVVCAGSTCSIVVNSAANNAFILSSSAGGTSITMANSSTLSFIRIGAQWLELREGSNTLSI